MAISTRTSERTDAGGRRSHIVSGILVAVLLAGIAVLAIGPSMLLLGPIYVAAVTPHLVRFDIDERRLPNRLVLPGYPAALAGITLSGVLAGASPAGALATGAAWFGFLLLLNLGGGMGMGDVKLAGVLGLCLGSISLVSAAAGLAFAFLFGGIAGILVLVRRVGGIRARIPFGPFLLAGFWVSVALTPVLAP